MLRLSGELVLSDDPAAQFTEILLEIANNTNSKFKTKLSKVPWFNDACKQTIEERKRAQRKLFLNPSVKNVFAFKQ